jgi:hypothetical protein
VNGGVRFLRLYDPLVADSQSLSGSEDIPLPITLTGRVGNGGTLSYVITANPTHGTLSGSGANLTYTPNANYSGEDSFKFRATYGAAFSGEATISLTVAPLNDNPNAQPDTVSTGKNLTVSISVLNNDTDVDGDSLTIVGVTQAENGSVNITSGGKTLSYKPRNGFSGTDRFSYTVSDGKGGIATATVTVNVLKK